MLKLAVFDLDGTLAPVGGPIDDQSVKLLKELEDLGIYIVISSGKTLYYLIGMFRQVGLRAPIFIGENGNVTAFGIDLPPKLLTAVQPTEKYFQNKDEIIRNLKELFPDGFWMQPNEIMLTLFFKNETVRNGIRKYLNNLKKDDIIVYEHVDSFDITPVGIDKKTSLQALGNHLHIASNEMIAVGDGANDLPMIDYCAYSIGIGALDKHLTTWHFDKIDRALIFLQEKIQHDQ